MIRYLAMGLWMIVGAISMAGCAYLDAGGGGGGGGSKDVYVYDGPGGPPPWAPAHGYRRKTAYRYYPDCDTYYNVQKKEYVYLDGGKWKHGKKPKHMHGGFVMVDIDGDDPEHYHHLVKPHYHHKDAHHHDKAVHHDVHKDTTHHDTHKDTTVHHDAGKHKDTDPHHDDHAKHVDTTKDAKGKGKGKDDKGKKKKK